MIKLAANLSLLFREVPFLDRFGEAARAGFTGVECQLPYDHDKNDIRERLERHRLSLVLHNLPAGNWDAGDRGIASDPARVGEFETGVTLALEYAAALGCRQLNCLAGIPPAGVSHSVARQTLVRNLRHAADRLKQAGVRLLVEPLNTRDIPGFFLSHTNDALAVIDDAGAENIALQFDVYHLEVMDGGVAGLLDRHAGSIGHIQIADVPGRHEPGTGRIDFADVFARIHASGYVGWIGCEYNPAGETHAGLVWGEPHGLAPRTRRVRATEA